jgi:flagellar biosynthesis protein FlhG
MVRRADGDDQAAGLRRLLADRTALRTAGLFGPDAGLNAMASAHLVHALAQANAGVCVLDEAPGPRNVAGQFGLAPRHGLAEVLRGEVLLEEALLAAPAGAALLRAGQGRMAGADERAWAMLADEFAATDWSWLLLAAPVEPRGTLALAASRRLLVLPASRARLTDAYAILKGVQQEQPDGVWQVLIMNVTDGGQAARLADSLADTARRFLGVELGFLGFVPRDPSLEQAARSMRPLLEMSPAAPAAAAFRELAEAMRAWPPLEAGMDARAFWQRLGLFSRLHGRASTPQPSPVRHGRAYG